MSDEALPHKRPVPPGRWQHWLEGAGALVLFGLFRLLPLDWASATGGFLARAIGPRLGATKRARLNLQRALPHLSEAETRRVIRGMWDNLGRVVAEYPHLREIEVYAPAGRVETINTAVVDPLLARGKKLIFVSAHFGNWEIAALAATQRGLGIAQVYRAANNPLVDRLIGRFRSVIGSELIPKGSVAARRAIEALREGRHLAMLVDQKMNDGIPVPFLGRPAMTAPAVAQLALRFDCVIIPARVERLGGARFRLTAFAPIEISRTGDRQADTLAIMTRINAVIGDWIRERPELWFWLHRRWPE
jgi:Kdo2-lipid IVA lauroyltransferase/acyltransferase